MKRFILLFSFCFVFHFSYCQLILTPADTISVTVNSVLLNNPWVGGINYPIWSTIDLNGDGILDLFCYDVTNSRITTYLNDGTQSEHPFHYAPQYASRFPKPPPFSWGKCFDYNCDGKMDYFTLDSLLTGIAAWRNDYTIATGLQFTQVSPRLMETSSNPSPNAIFASSNRIPSFIDMDDDGDMDILGLNSSADKRVSLHRNLSIENNGNGNCDSLTFRWETKCWGNFLFATGSNKVESFNDTCLPPEPNGFIEPAYDATDLARRDDSIVTIFPIDLDGDGDKELLVGDAIQTNSLMVHNGGTPRNAMADGQDTLFPIYDTPVDIPEFVSHAYIDVDNDGLRDLLVSAGFNENKRGVWAYKNVAADTAPYFNFLKDNFMQEEMIEEGQAAAPVFFDYDSDGLLDMVIAYGVYQNPNGVLSRLALYKNVGTLTQPAFDLITDDYASISTEFLQSPIYPAFGDIDGDGDVDLIVGDFNGKMNYFTNTAGAGNIPSYQFVTGSYMGIDIGSSATPQIIDLDRDGLPDILLGEQNGTLNFCKNVGTITGPFFNSLPTIDTLGFVNVQHNSFSGFSVPYVFLDSGHYEMMVGNMNGDVFLYNNIEGNLNGAFTLVSTLITDTLGVCTNNMNLTVSGGDLNNDGKTDFAIGLFSGGVKIYYGNSSIVGINEVSSQPQLFQVFPNPANSSLTIRVLERLHDKNLEVFLYNSLGEKVLQQPMNDSFSTLDIKNLSEGTYFVQVVNSTTSQFMKVVISH